MLQAADEAALDRVGTACEHDGYSRACRLGRYRRCLTTEGNDDGHLSTREIGGEPRQSIVLTFRPTIVEGDVLTLDKASFIETLADDRNEGRVDGGRTGAEQPDHRHRRLLRPRRQRPCHRRATEQDELAPPHSITSSA